MTDPKNPIRHCDFDIHKHGGVVRAHFRGSSIFRRAAITPAMPRERIFAVDTESLSFRGDLTTLLVPVHFHQRGVVLETPEGTGMLESLFAAVWEEGFAVEEPRPSRTAQRKKRGDGDHRDGERQSVEPVLGVFFNFPYDAGRLLADKPDILRAVAAGADSYKVRLSRRFELEVRRLILGTAPSFDFRVRDKTTKTIVRMLGMDLVGYWKTSLAKCAKALGVTEKVDIETMIDRIYERTRESLTEEEWALFRSYGLGDVQSTLEVYHRTCDLLVQVDARVMRKTGVIPPSAPGASARIVFAKAFDCHPEMDSWRRYPAWADQMGCDSYYGGRAFCSRPGIYTRMTSLDLKSAYPFAMACLPDPVTVEASRVSDGKFVPEWYRGRFGVLCVSGEETNDVMPAFRTHDAAHHGRLRYVAGRFERAWVTIPELVIGHLRGTLRIDRVHDGVVMKGSPDRSFIRAAIADFFAIKENKGNEKALRDLAKLLMNSFYGKLIEVVATDYLVGEEILTEDFLEKGEVCRTITLLFAGGGHLEAKRFYWGKDEASQRLGRGEFERTFGDDPDRWGPPDTAAAYAIYFYVEALRVAGEPSHKGQPTSVGRYVSSHKSYKCGQYFMPAYATQITGLTSATVGLMADCLGALQGDTDSVHFQLPEGEKHAENLPGYARYFDLMAQAGYPAPRKVGGEYVGGIDSIPNLGAWEQESDEPSLESILVRPKLYSHHFPDVVDKSGSSEPCYKQAKHGFAKFHTPKVDAALRDMTLARQARIKIAEAVRASELHEAMRAVHTAGSYSYETRAAPLKLRTAIRSGRTPGRFESRPMKLMATGDPNNYLGEDGFIHWGAPPRQAKEAG